MVESIRQTGSPYFRWFDSGDLQGVDHLAAIVGIAKALPEVKFWLPTQEHKVVSKYFAKHARPDNLCIRLSSRQVDKVVVDDPTFPVSFVATAPALATCPARHQDGKCDECRNCWDPTVKVVGYAKH